MNADRLASAVIVAFLLRASAAVARPLVMNSGYEARLTEQRQAA